MKLCKLKLKNLNSFHGEIELDFENSPLDNASLVAITGPTGAGKTTLLDAICVVLYGKTPRLTGSGSQNPSHLISHGETDSHAELHFVADGVRYLAEWSIRRGSSPKGQLRSTENGELITDKLSSKGKSLGSSGNTIAEEITTILGLDFDAFKRSVMLAQGEFAAFLKAKDEERRTILEATAGVDIYDRLKEALNQKVRETENTHQAVMQKLIGIPDVTSEQIVEAENHLRDLKANADALDVHRQEIQVDKQREVERTAWFSDLHLAEKRNEVLLNQQTEIATLKTELERADRANHLRPEKQAFDTAGLELKTAETSRRQAATELVDAQSQFDANQTDFDEKDNAYVTGLAQYNQTTDNYNAAKLDVRQATDRFERAADIETDLPDLVERIETLSTELTEDSETYIALEAEVGAIETFLVDNQLPPDRQERITSANMILAEHRIKQEQLTERSEAEIASASDVSRLSTELVQLDADREEIAARKEALASSLANADTTLTTLQERGTLEEWRIRRQSAEQALPIVLQYETIQDQLVQAEDDLQGFQDRVATFNSELERVTSQLACQSQACQDADEAVKRWEVERESALLVDPINQLRRRLQPGEPCPVCGATEHLCGDDIESEATERLENAENALANAREVAERAHECREELEREEIRINQDMSNITTQVKASREEIHQLKSDVQSIIIQWREIYPNAEVSSDWINQQVREAGTAIETLQKAHESHTQASHLCQEISQQLDNFEQNVARERSLLDNTKQDLQVITNAVQDLKAEIADIEARFWELVPDAFHGIGLEEAVNQFVDRITAVAMHERERDQKKSEIAQLDIGIREKQRSLATEQERHRKLEAEIEGYRNEGDSFLNAAREKTDGLTTINGIDTAIKKLAKALQVKSAQRDEAEQLFQESQTELTKARTNHSHHLSQHTKCSQNFETAKQTYLERLSEVGFDSPEAHDSAFQEEAWRQQTAETITTYTEEKQRLEVDIARLRAIFEENPFNPELLETIEATEQEIGTEHDEKQQEIGVQQKEINRLKDALTQRTTIDAKIQQSGQELERWQRLQNTIPANNLRDFALDIMFRQMGRLANTQLDYLTSGRYQLKVEGIGKLIVVDRWNANEKRPVETLSGGESFLTSLALALALSELSRGRSQIHSLFLDEGFGTLDSETLDVAIAALEGLQMQGRSIFLISHIGELTRRIPVRIAVQKMGNGSSQVRVHG